jgi:hypothetical protein
MPGLGGRLINHRLYRYTAIGRPLDASFATNRAVLILLPLAALLGAVVSLTGGDGAAEALRTALWFALIAFGSWALARELDPDDNPAAFISLGAGLLVALGAESVGLLVVFVTLGLVRIVNRTTGLPARKSDSAIMAVLAILVIYTTDSPLFGLVAGLAFILDGSLREPARHQWLFGLVCVGAAIVYAVDHDVGLHQLAAPDSLFEWLGLLALLVFGLNTLLLRKVHARGDANRRRLDVNRVRGGMTIGLLAGLQGLTRIDRVAVIVAVIAGICIGMAIRKGFRAPAGGPR